MKKLNRKGFTLIELLAIIVILAVILVVAVPPLLDVMDNSKKSALINSAKSVASGWTNNLATSELNPPTSGTTEYGLYVDVSAWSGWKCLTTTQMSTLKIDSNQYVSGLGTETVTATAPICSAAKITNGAVEVILVVESGDQMFLDSATDTIGTKKLMWASSTGSNSWSN